MTHTSTAHPITPSDPFPSPADSVAPVLAALAGKLAAAGRAASEARAALARGEPVAAIGALLPTEQVLRDALALHTAAVVLHLEPG